MDIQLNNLAKTVHTGNKLKGFYDEKRNFGEILALIHSEVSEALEADRKGRYAKLRREDIFLLDGARDKNEYRTYFRELCKDTVEDEIADAMIRLLDLVGYLGIDIDTHIRMKLKFNSMRQRKHGKKY